ncbi:MAG: HypC/HybG/HupF family hydrogenase formation chaperone [Burkholderiaceae bacterium]|nr:HypC/HybG/HupF family hydrogenase formation chaperone [Burkholderiaceae bacterium]
MCLALPARIVAALDAPHQVLAELGGVRKAISIELTPEARVGDYVVVHVGHALAVLDADEAERTLALFGELSAQQAAEPPS